MKLLLRFSTFQPEAISFGRRLAAGGVLPGGPYPLLAVSGEQGSAKTVLSKILRALIYPNAAPVRTAPREERDLFIAAGNGHLLAFDNLSDLGCDHAAINKSLAEKARPTSGRLCALCSIHDDFKLRDASQFFLMTTCFDITVLHHEPCGAVH